MLVLVPLNGRSSIHLLLFIWVVKFIHDQFGTNAYQFKEVGIGRKMCNALEKNINVQWIEWDWDNFCSESALIELWNWVVKVCVVCIIYWYVLDVISLLHIINAHITYIIQVHSCSTVYLHLLIFFPAFALT